jgi:Fic family protein
MYQPQFDINEVILNLCSGINRLLGRYEGLSGARPQPQLRRLNRIRTIQGSLAIEGNSLSLAQVTDILDGKRIVGPKHDIIEVKNANTVYEKVSEFNPYSVKSLLEAHRILMNGVLPDAGKWRTGAIGIMKGSKVSHIGPKAHFVQGMVKELLTFVKDSSAHPLITSSVFHHEFEVIHPFSDGNGRMGRLWQHILLVRFHPLFEFVPTESIIRSRQAEYYRALEESDRSRKSTQFIEFMLRAILDGTEEFLKQIRLEPLTGIDRLAAAKENFGQIWFSRKDYQGFFVTLSAPTASRDLKLGVDKILLERTGDKARARYRFRIAKKMLAEFGASS